MNNIIKQPYFFYVRYFLNRVVAYIPSWHIRKIFYLISGMKIGTGSRINMGVYVLEPKKIRIGQYTHINQGCILDGRGKLIIGDSVSISHRVCVMTGSHDKNSKNFSGKFRPIEIHNNVWVGVNATILQDIVIGEGAVVAACSLVTKNVGEYDIVGGVPAKKISERTRDLDYKCNPKCTYL